MRTLMLLALVSGLFLACSGEPAQDAAPAGPSWLTDRPEHAHVYADETLARFRKLVEGTGWCDAAWNAQGTLEMVHEKTGLTFVLIPAGSFLMGSPASEADRDDDETQHRVTVPASLLCKTECTQRAWDAVGGEDDREWKGPDLPIETVSWTAAEAWCRKAGLRLPSESEWEYACRAGTETPFSTGETLTTDQANYNGSSPYAPYAGGRKGEFRSRTVLAGSLPANPWGLYEMHGNVREWCADWDEESYAKTPRDGSAYADGSSGSRAHRGGCWRYYAGTCRSAFRWGLPPGSRGDGLGFRPASKVSGD